MSDKTYFLPEIGPLLSIPEFVSYSTITDWRNIGLTGDARSAEASGHVAINDNIKYVDWQGRPWTVADGANEWHDLCGMHLYSPGLTPEDEPLYSGYNIVWQFRVESVSNRDGKIVWYNIDQRMIIRTEAGVLSQNLAFVRTSFGYNSTATKNLSMGYTGIETQYNNKNFIGFGLAGNWEYTSEPFQRQIQTAILAINKAWFTNNQYIIKEEKTDDPNAGDPGGPSKPGGGGGNHSYADDDIPLPTLPTLGAAASQMVTIYRMSDIDMATFAHDLWSDGWTQIKAFFSDPMDFVVGCMVLPYQPTVDGSAKPKFGIFTWQNAYNKVKPQYQSISCGEIDINEFYGSCFDYDPYRKIQIYLPYIGYRDLPVDKIMNKTIAVTYYCDCFTGDCVAFVHTPAVGPAGPQKTQVIGQYAGNLGVRIPLSRQSWDAAVSAGISLLGGAVAMAAGGIAQGMGLEAKELSASQIGNQAGAATMSAVNAAKTSVKRSGTQGATAGYMSIQDPFIIDTIPRQSLPTNYIDLEGYPSNIYGNVGSFQGFLAVEKIKLETTATEPEKEMIMQLLKGGIYV